MIVGISVAHWLVVVSEVVGIGGSAAYIRDTLAGRSKPNLVSWSMWALAPLIGAAAALSADADVWATVRILLVGFLSLLILFASFINPQSYWKLGPFDFACGICALLALSVWGFASSPRLAILLAAVGDGFASLPTIRKAWSYPETETGVTYIASFISAVLIIPSIPVWNIENSAFQIYLLTANTLLLFCVYRKRFGLVYKI